jgi:hypothetical protein
MIRKRNWKFSLVLLVFLLFLMTACAGQQSKPADQGQAEPESQQAEQVPDQPLAKKYPKIVVSEVTSNAEIKKDYPDALNECQANLVWALENKKTYQSVARNKPGMKYPAGCLLVQANVSDMRIVHGAARFWGGAFAGSSFMEIDLKLIDAATQKTVRQKHISSANNAWAASWMGGSSDRSLPSDMGKILADYIDSIIPK